jgi:hypothetical protein
MGAQVAVALVLLFGSGLLIRSFLSIRGVSPGFAQDHLLTIRMPAPDVSSAVLESDRRSLANGNVSGGRNRFFRYLEKLVSSKTFAFN